MRFLFLSILITLLASTAIHASPRIERIDELRTNFGTIEQGEVLTFTFRFRNSGDETLVINEVKSTCNCTAALLSSDRLAPGEEGRVTATYDSKNDEGKVGRRIKLYTNDPIRPVEEFHIVGIVIISTEISSRYMNFKVVEIGQVVERAITIKNITTDTLHIKGFGFRDKIANITLAMSASEILPESEVQLVGTCKAEIPGKMDGFIFVEFLSEKIPAIEIRVVGIAEEYR